VKRSGRQNSAPHNSAATANRFAKRLRAGSVWVNAWGPPHPALPWLGVKTSGLGQELGRTGILANTVEKTVSVIS
jgi:acyl-CoA reductase-like NAD-dependent aldehyde dehydrogenase